VYEWAKRILVSDHTQSKAQVVAPFLAGAFARLMATTVKIPFDVVKQRLEVQGALLNPESRMYSGTIDAFRKIATREGFAKGLWTGFFITLLRDLPFSATYFTSYELSKHYQKVILERLNLLGDHDLNIANHLVAGATAGCFASSVTMPIDAIKTRIQTETLTHKKQAATVTTVGGAGPTLPPAARKGILATAKLIYAKEGVRGFYQGLVPRLLSIIPSASITFASYEMYKKFLNVS